MGSKERICPKCNKWYDIQEWHCCVDPVTKELHSIPPKKLDEYFGDKEFYDLIEGEEIIVMPKDNKVFALCESCCTVGLAKFICYKMADLDEPDSGETLMCAMARLNCDCGMTSITQVLGHVEADLHEFWLEPENWEPGWDE